MNKKTNKKHSSTTPNIFILGLVSTLSQSNVLTSKMQSEYMEKATKISSIESSKLRPPKNHTTPHA